MDPSIPLLTFFKALSDETRLKIVGLLARAPRSVEELAAMLEVSAPTVSHHLSRLQEAGLVRATAQQYYSVYALQTQALREMAQRVLSTDELAQVAVNVDQDAYSTKVLKNYVIRGRLKIIPSQLKKRQVIVRWLAGRFEPGARYTEKEVNEILRRVYEDWETLRRELVDMHYLERQGGIYWRAAA